MKNGATYFKYSVLLVGIVLLFYLLKGCFGNHSGNGDSKPDTIKVTQTVTVEKVVNHTSYIPRPYKVIQYKDRIDTLTEYVVAHIDSAEVVKDFLSTKYYRDTVKNKYGYVLIEDTVTQNKLTGQGVKTEINVPTITKTYTITAKKQWLPMIGAGVFGNKENIIYATEFDLGIKARNNKIYYAKGLLDRKGDLSVGGGVMIPIGKQR